MDYLIAALGLAVYLIIGICVFILGGRNSSWQVHHAIATDADNMVAPCLWGWPFIVVIELIAFVSTQLKRMARLLYDKILKWAKVK